MVETTLYEVLKADVDKAGNFHGYLADQKGPARIVDGKMTFGQWTANGDFEIVDLVKQVTRADATTFQLIDGKLIRVATTIQRLDGTGRGVGTELIGPAAAAFARGESYLGIGPILGRDFIARYDMLRDPSGRPIGYLLTAIPLANLASVVLDAQGRVVGPVVIGALIVLLLSAALLALVMRPIARTIAEVVATARRIAEHDMPGQTRVLQAVARGDLAQHHIIRTSDLPVTRRDELGLLAQACHQILGSMREVAAVQDQAREQLRELVEQTRRLIRAAEEESLRQRSDAAQFQGADRDLVSGINAMLDAMTGPLEDASAVLARVAEGDLTARPAGLYRGDFARIRDSLEVALDRLSSGLWHVQSSAEGVAGAASNITSGSQQLAQGAALQASSL